MSPPPQEYVICVWSAQSTAGSPPGAGGWSPPSGRWQGCRHRKGGMNRGETGGLISGSR